MKSSALTLPITPPGKPVLSLVTSVLCAHAPIRVCVCVVPCLRACACACACAVIRAYRRKILVALDVDFKEEVQWVNRIAAENPKNYQIWYARTIAHASLLVANVADCAHQVSPQGVGGALARPLVRARLHRSNAQGYDHHSEPPRSCG